MAAAGMGLESATISPLSSRNHRAPSRHGFRFYRRAWPDLALQSGRGAPVQCRSLSPSGSCWGPNCGVL